MKIGIQTNISTQMFISAPFTIVSKWKLFKRPPTDEWMNGKTKYGIFIQGNDIIQQ